MTFEQYMTALVSLDRQEQLAENDKSSRRRGAIRRARRKLNKRYDQEKKEMRARNNDKR